MRYQVDRPIVLGLAGEGGSGKTATADYLAPKARFTNEGSIWWEPLAAATPLYELASIRKKTEGDRIYDRMAYAAHDVLVDLFGYPLYGAPCYQDLVSLVQEVCSFPINPEDEKPRDFLQWAGGAARKFMPDCFTSWMHRKINSLYAYYRSEHADEETDVGMFGVVLSDLRMENEVEFVRNTVNGVMIKLTAPDYVRQERLFERDGIGMSAAQRQHNTETWIASASDDCFDAIVDTGELTIVEQVNAVLGVVSDKLGVLIPKKEEQRESHIG